MTNEEKLRQDIARYIAKEMELSQTPAYSLNASEQSYGIMFLIKSATYLKGNEELPKPNYGDGKGYDRTSKLIGKAIQALYSERVCKAGFKSTEEWKE